MRAEGLLACHCPLRAQVCPSLGRSMDELGAFSGAPGILGPWWAVVGGAPGQWPCFL